MEQPGKALDSDGASAPTRHHEEVEASADPSNDREHADNDRQAESTSNRQTALRLRTTYSLVQSHQGSQREAGELISRSERTVRRRMQGHALRRKIQDYRYEIRDQFLVKLDAALLKRCEP